MDIGYSNENLSALWLDTQIPETDCILQAITVHISTCILHACRAVETEDEKPRGRNVEDVGVRRCTSYMYLCDIHGCR